MSAPVSPKKTNKTDPEDPPAEDDKQLRHKTARVQGCTALISLLAAAIGLVAAAAKWGEQAKENASESQPTDSEDSLEERIKQAKTELNTLEAKSARLRSRDAVTIEALRERIRLLDEIRRDATARGDTWWETPGAGITPIAEAVSRECDEAIRRDTERITDLEIDAALERLDEAVGKPEAFATILARMPSEHPGSPRATTLAAIADEAPAWRSVLAWDAFFQNSAFRASPMTPDAAQKINALESDLRSRHWITPLASDYEETVREYFLAVAARRNRLRHSLVSRLRSDLDAFGGRDLFLVRLSDKRLLYTRTDPRAIEVDRRGQVTLPVIFSAIDLPRRVPVREEQIADRGRAPHYELSRHLSDGFTRTEDRLDTEWVDLFLKALDRVLKHERIDPTPHALIYRGVLETACNGSLALRTGFASQLDQIERAHLDPATPWLDTDNAEAVGARRSSETLLRTLSSFDEARSLSLKSFEALRAWRPIRVIWSGWLARTSEGRWRVAGRRESEDGDLCVALQDPAGEKRLVVVGRISNGQVVWDNTAELRVGRPLFVASPSLRMSLD